MRSSLTNGYYAGVTLVGVRRAETERRAVSAYVRHRLELEHQQHGRGRLAAIADATGFSTAQISNAKTGMRGAGANLALALARFWGMTYELLVETAVAWARDNNAPLAPRPRLFRDRPEWGAAVAEAQAFFRDIPAALFEELGAMVNTADRAVDARFVGELAKVIHELDHRANAPRSATEPTAPPKNRRRAS